MTRQEDLRVGDADRDAVATALREHFAQGRLTLDELRERLDATFAARTFGDLVPITDDLPGRASSAPALPGAVRPAEWRREGWAPPWPPGGPWMRRGGPPVPFGLLLFGVWLLVVVGSGHGWLVFAPVLFLILFGRMRRRAWAQHQHVARGRQIRRW
jgi:hypothetical protein